MRSRVFSLLCRAGLLTLTILQTPVTAQGGEVQAGPGEAGLRAALEAAQEGDTVLLDPAENLPLSAPVRVTKRLTIRYAPGTLTRFIYNDTGGELFQIAAEGTVLENLTLIGSGNAPTDGVRVDAGFTMRNCTLRGLRQPLTGDDPEWYLSRHVVRLEGCTAAQNENGLRWWNLEAKDSVFAANGGVNGGWTVDLERCTFENNAQDGLICVVGTVKSCTFRFNGDLGLRFDPDPGNLLLSGCLFYANNGGGLLLREEATATVDNCIFTRHTGNPAVMVSEAYHVVFRHCTVTDNLFIDTVAPGAWPPNPWGGAFTIGLSGSVELENCLIADNPDIADPNASGLSGPWVDLGGNVIGGPARLGALSNNGGPVLTLLPLPDSPAIDAGVNRGPVIDARGFARVAGKAPDAGAVERGAAAAADADSDGLPDVWERRFGLNPGNPADAVADADGDGQSALDEFRCGTSPVDGASVLGLAESGLSPYPGNTNPAWTFNTRWTAQPGILYRVQTSDNLVDWQNMPDLRYESGVRDGKWMFGFYAVEEARRRFYRVTVIGHPFAP